MISSEEALGILRRWTAKGDWLKLMFSTGRVLTGVVSGVTEGEITFTSGGNPFAISLKGTSFRKVPREEVMKVSSSWNWDESLELRLAGGDIALFLRLSDKPPSVATEDSN